MVNPCLTTVLSHIDICGKPCGMLQNAYKNTNLLANKCMFAQKNPSINQLLALQVQF